MSNAMLIIVMTSIISFQANALTGRQKEMLTVVNSMANVYESMYAPALWKKEFANWTLQAAVADAKESIQTKELTLTEYHKVVNKFILSMKDYHTSVKFYTTEKATLPFMVRGTKGRYFIVYINREKLPKDSFQFDLGDELLEMNDRPVADIIQEYKASLGANTEETDQALAEMSLTSRSAANAQTVPQGPVELKFKKGDKESSYQLIWDYKKENVLLEKSHEVAKNPIFNLKMTTGVSEDLEKEAKEENLFSIGGKKSYLPALGTKIWSSNEDSSFDAYIYLNSKKELVGYIRIPTYSVGEKESAEFKEIIKKFSETTDKLVIDQLNNPGGSVFYLYSLVSMLADKPMAAPKHYMAINQNMVVEAINELEKLKKITTQEEMKKYFDGQDTISGYPLSLSFVEFMKDHFQFIIDEWKQGKKLTSPHFLYGVDKINPHPEVNYAKPILLLVNELDFSGGDFFPTILQDNKRATIMGVRTAGAGGYVLRVEIPNQLGIASFRYTGSLADRIDHKPIENLGVTPDIQYAPTIEDYQNGFKPFGNKINEVIESLN